MSAKALILDKMLPLAKGGLQKLGIDDKEIENYLSVIEGRARTHMTGSRWIVTSYRNFRKHFDREEATVALTAVMDEMRKTGKPVFEWDVAGKKKSDYLKVRYDIVSSVMTTDLVTVQENDLAELVQKIMEWRNIRHMPVESSKGELRGIITKKHLNDYLKKHTNDPYIVASEIMEENPAVISPDDDLKYAMLLLLDKKVSCLPVVDENRLVGIITDHDTREIWEKMKHQND